MQGSRQQVLPKLRETAAYGIGYVPIMGLEEAREVAYDWHGGLGSPLYSFASTGVVWDEAHRRALHQESPNNVHVAAEFADDEESLDRLHAFIKSARAGEREVF